MDYRKHEIIVFHFYILIGEKFSNHVLNSFRFDLMRQDPHLSFLSKCGPPSSSEESAIMNKTLDGDDTKVLDEDEDR